MIPLLVYLFLRGMGDWDGIKMHMYWWGIPDGKIIAWFWRWIPFYLTKSIMCSLLSNCTWSKNDYCWSYLLPFSPKVEDQRQWSCFLISQRPWILTQQKVLKLYKPSSEKLSICHFDPLLNFCLILQLALNHTMLQCLMDQSLLTDFKAMLFTEDLCRWSPLMLLKIL